MMVLTVLFILVIVACAFVLHIVCLNARLLKRLPLSSPALRALLVVCYLIAVPLMVCVLFLLLSFVGFDRQWFIAHGFVSQVVLAISVFSGLLLEEIYLPHAIVQAVVE